MHIKPIETEQDYKNALKRLEIIFDAEAGSKDGEESEALGILIDEFEKKHYPIDLSDLQK